MRPLIEHRTIALLNVLLKQFGLAILYALIARLVLNYFSANGLVSVVWPSSGLALAALLVGGKRYAWGVFLGAFMASAMAGLPLWASATIASGNTLEALLGAWLLTREGCFDSHFRSLRDYLRLIALAGMLGVSASTLIGATTLLISGFLSGEVYFLNLLHWWMGHALATMVMTPLILTWRRLPLDWFGPRRAIEVILALGLAFLVAQIVFLDRFHDTFGQVAGVYWMFLIVTWTAVRLGTHGVLAIIVITGIHALLGAHHGTGYFADDMAKAHLANFWFFMVALSLTGMTLATYFTERKRVEEALAESESRNRRMIETAREGVWSMDATHHTTYVNATMAAMLGYDADEMIGRCVEDFLFPEDMDEHNKQMAARHQGIDGTYEKRFLRKDGSELWTQVSATPVEDEDGRFAGSFAMLADITERKHAELKASALIRRNQVMMRNALEGIHILDDQGKLLEANDSFCRHLGYTQAEARQLSVFDWEAKMTADELRTAIRDLLDGQAALFETVHRRKDGTLIDVEVSVVGVELDGRKCLYASNRDITERKQAEAALREAQQRAQEERDRAQLYLEVAEVIIVVLDEEARIQLINRKGCETLGWSEEELVGKSWPDYCAEGVREAWRIYHNELMAGLASVKSMAEYPIVSRTGGEQLIEWRRHVLRDAEGKPYGTVSSGLDVTADRLVQRTLAQYQDDLESLVRERTAELEASEEKIRLILESSVEGIFGLDVAGRFTFVNPAACQMLGYPSEHLIGQDVHALIHHTRADGTPCPPEECPILSVLRVNRLVRGDEEVLWRGDGQAFPVEFTAASVSKQGAIIGAVASFHDISRRKQAELATQAALMEAQRLARVRSDFLANMSHEIRTPLNAVLGLAQVGARSSKGRKLHNNFNRILDSGQLLLSVVNDILDFSKIEAGKLVIERAPFSLGEVLDHAVDINAARAFGKGLSLELEEAADLPGLVMGDQTRLTQVLVNLIGNAVKFTEHGGVRLSVLTGTSETGSSGILFRLVDSGIGMTEEQVARLFQPFEQADGSTTRRFGGTGLGLTISKRLVDAMGGEIHVESHIGRGTSFDVWLPLVAAGEVSPPPLSANLGMVLAGFEAQGGEERGLCAALRARGIRVVAVPLAAAFEQPGGDLIVLAGEALQDKAAMSTFAPSQQKKQRMVVVMTPGKELKLPYSIQEQLEILYRPLRVRHLLMAGARDTVHQATPFASDRLSGLNVLAVEDNEVNQIVLEDILALEGARVMLAANGREALDRLREQGARAFDVVLTDIQMPEMDGYELARHVLDLAPGLPVIGLTANAMPEDRERCLTAGMLDHVAKPIDIDVLVEALLRHVVQRSASPSAGGFMPGSSGGVVDWVALENRFNGRQAFIDKLVSVTLDTHAATPAKLRDAVKWMDLDAIAFIAHGLKGLGGYLFAQRIYELGARTEASARGGQPNVAELAGQLADAVETMLAELAVHGREGAR